MKRILPLTILLSSLSAIVEVNAQADKCPAVDCDCEYLTDSAWRKECRDYEAGLRKACAANQGEPLSYCRLHGPRARPVALSVQLPALAAVDEEGIEALERKIKVLVFSATDDLKMAQALEAREDFGLVLSMLKEYEKSQSLVHEYRQQIARSWIALDEADKATEMWRDIAGQENAIENTFKQRAQTLWTRAEAAGIKSKTKRLLQFLAMRYLSNAGNHLERVADAFAQAGEPAKAAEHWQQAAGLAEQMVKWKVAAKSGPAYVRYYGYQSAARWHRAAIYWMQSEIADQAAFSRDKAQGLLEELGAGS